MVLTALVARHTRPVGRVAAAAALFTTVGVVWRVFEMRVLTFAFWLPSWEIKILPSRQPPGANFLGSGRDIIESSAFEAAFAERAAKVVLGHVAFVCLETMPAEAARNVRYSRA